MQKHSTNLGRDAALINTWLRRRVPCCREPWNPFTSILVFSLLCALLSAGCVTREKPDYLASVEIEGNTPGQIAAATEAVFSANGYKLASSGAMKLMFEKPGSGMNKFAYGDWVGDSQVWVRVKLNLIPAGEALFRMDCRAFLVKDKGGSTEEEIKVSSMHHRPYQKLLDDVAARLKPKSAKP